MHDTVLEIRNLCVNFRTEDGDLPAVRDVSFSIPRGKVVALVGESGSGKSVTSYSILRLIQKPGRIVRGEIVFRDHDGTVTDLARLNENDDRLYQLRGNRISMIFQEPMSALSPVHTIGDQLSEVIHLHRRATRAQARDEVVQMLERVGIPAPERRYAQYPFELSGGMRQRVVIAMAMLAGPDLLIADEPTTALDVTIQAQILALIDKLQRQSGNSVLLITHDLGVVAQVADLVVVMYLGRIVERGPMREVMKSPLHPYTRGLLNSLPGLHLARERLPSIKGSVPSLREKVPGCPFHPRCPHSRPGICDGNDSPGLVTVREGREAACFRIHELEGALV